MFCNFVFVLPGKKKNTWGTTTTTAGPSSASSSSFRFLSENQNPSLPIKKLFSLSLSLFDLLFLLCFFCLLLSYKETILQGRNCYHQYLIRLSNWRIVQTKLKKEIFVYLWIYGTTHQLYYSATQVPHQPPPTFYFFCFFSENCRWVLAYDPFACWENMGK